MMTDDQVQKVMPHRPGITSALAVIDLIMGGTFDTNLDIIENAIDKRKDQIAQNRALSLKVGDRVIVQGLGMGAKYLNGAPATVIGFAIKNIKIRIDRDWDTRRYSHDMRMPPQYLRLVREEPAGELNP